MRRRFFVEQFADGRAVMRGDGAHHLGHVLRAEAGQLYELSDGARVCLARIEKVSSDRVEFTVVEELPGNDPAIHITLLLAVVKFDAFEWAIEKATELGVGTIVPLAARHSEKALVAAAAKRATRWQKILLAASQQCRRMRVPVLETLRRPEQAFRLHRAPLAILLSERAQAPPLREILAGSSASSAVLAVGPEGGWSDGEMYAARKAELREAALGKLILRTETAVTAALAIANYALGA